MKLFLFVLTTCLIASCSVSKTSSSPPQPAHSKVSFFITQDSEPLGEIVFELHNDRTPVTADNFLEYIDSGFYNGTIFHRVIPGFVAQAGGHLPDMSLKETNDPITNEAKTAASNLTGTIGMARTEEPDSATSQFYINLKDNSRLDFSLAEEKIGYAVFGQVTSGMDVVRAIESLETTTVGEYENVPTTKVVIESTKRVP